MTGTEDILTALWGGLHSLCSANGDALGFGCVGIFDKPADLLEAADLETAARRHVWWGVHPLRSRSGQWPGRQRRRGRGAFPGR